MGTVPSNQIELTVADSSRMPWEILEVPQIDAKIPVKVLFSDPDTGMEVFLIRYAAGFTNTWHTHPHAHGMYILDGILNTHKGEFGPGSFVWFPEGGWMEHGATAVNDHPPVHHEQAVRDLLRAGREPSLSDGEMILPR